VRPDVTQPHPPSADAGCHQVDALTGLADRASLLRALTSALADPADGAELVLAAIDVDHLTLVNERYGRPGGDAVLRAVALRIGGVVRRTDIVARTGGGEFAVLAAWGPGDPDLLRFAERIRRAVEREPVRHRRVSIGVTISVGVARAAEATGGADHLLAVGDRRLLRAKRLGRNRVVMT
jgi:diguanylate cyclase (GGDEF)-like protein